MKRIKVNPPYIALTQQKLCCVPCSIQWILLRRGLRLVEQEVIGRELDLTVPKKYAYLFEKVKVANKKPKQGWGTQESGSSKIDKFLKKYRIPLRVENIPYSQINDAAKIIVTNLKKGNDIMLVTFMSTIDPKKKFGHALLVSKITTGKRPQVIVGDPNFTEKKFYKVDLGKVIKGMNPRIGKVERGIYIFSKAKS